MSIQADARVRPWIFLIVLALVWGLLAAPAQAQDPDPCTTDPTLPECSTASSSTDGGGTTESGGTSGGSSGGSEDPPPDGNVDPDDGDVLNQPFRFGGWVGNLEAWMRSVLGPRFGLLDRR